MLVIAMPRPIQVRTIAAKPAALRFEPVLGPADEPRPPVVMGLDEAEALRLADVEGLYQEEIAARLGVSRATAGRILEAARRAVATAISEGRPLHLIGGAVAVCSHREARCPVHGGPRRAGRRCRCDVSADGRGEGSKEDEMSASAGSQQGRRGLGRGNGHRTGQGQRGMLVLPAVDKELGATFRVAVPTTDGVHLSEHLGRSACFVVAEVRDFAVAGKCEVAVGGGPHRHGAECGAGHGHGCGSAEGAGPRHASISRALSGVDVVLVGGAGRRILEDLVASGVRIEPASGDSVDAALKAFLESVRPPDQGQLT
jgi:predicted DNA-binding protein (UPF0251 family)/predicted Fe-Mo cluster-binding NifX family protein